MSVSNYTKHFSTKETPQSQPIPGKEHLMEKNNAGGFTFVLNDWDRLDRFLVLGTEGNTFYCSEREMTVDNAKVVQRCLQADPSRTVQRIVQISKEGRAPKNDPAIFALAMAAGNPSSSKEALEALPEVCRIGTHLFSFCEAVEKFRGHGRALNRTLSQWYLSKSPRDVSYQVSKYQQRNGWSHRDILRLARPKASGLYQDIFHWIVKGWPGVGDDPHPEKALHPIWALEKAKRAASEKEIVRLIQDFDLVRECIPTNFLNSPEVWDALLEKMPLTAMIRNLAKMTSIGLLKPLSKASGKVIGELTNQERLKRSRVHPIAVLSALKTYAQGHGERGKLSWNPISQIVDALDGAFYNSFQNVEPTNKRWLLALDVSGSMGSGMIAGVPGLTPRIASAAMALITAAVEPHHAFVAFTSSGWHSSASGPSQWAGLGFSNGITPLSISTRQRLDNVCQQVESLRMGGTDCALPMLYATDQKLEVDAFVVLTDNETWAGKIHPTQALQQYRQKMGIPSKLIVVGMTATQFSIADPNDSAMLDCVGFDSAAPAIMADFVRG